MTQCVSVNAQGFIVTEDALPDEPCPNFIIIDEQEYVDLQNTFIPELSPEQSTELLTAAFYVLAVAFVFKQVRKFIRR